MGTRMASMFRGWIRALFLGRLVSPGGSSEQNRRNRGDKVVLCHAMSQLNCFGSELIGSELIS